MDTMNCSLAMALSERVDWMGTYGLVITSCVKLRKERVSSARPHVFMQAICATFEVDFSLSCSRWTCRLSLLQSSEQHLRARRNCEIADDNVSTAAAVEGAVNNGLYFPLQVSTSVAR